MLIFKSAMQTFPNARRRRPKFRNCVANGMTFLTGMCIGVLLPYYLLYPSSLRNVQSGNLITYGAKDNTSDGYFVPGATDNISVSSEAPDEDSAVGGYIRSEDLRTSFFSKGSEWVPRTPFPDMFSGIGPERVVSSTSSDRYIHEPGVDALLPATAAATERPVAPGRTSRASFSGMRLGLPAVQRRPNSTAASRIARRHAKFLKSNPGPSSSSSSTTVPAGSAASSTEGDQQLNTPQLVDLVRGIFWTESAEKLAPQGFRDLEIREWRRYVNVTPVLKVQEGCGRMQNRLVTFEDGQKSCCRYRHNNDQIQGEIFSFYLGKLLGIANLVPSALALVDTRETRWAAAASQVSLAQWSSERPVVLTQFVDDLLPAYIPKHFQVKGHRRLHPIRDDLGNLTTDDIAQLLQWSDLVLFDYLTGNLDRVVNNMYNERWNSEMMRQPTHNLARTKDGFLLFLDNESGLLHGYRLLEKYENYHQSLLDGLCLFRENTAKAISDLHRKKSIEDELRRAFFEGDPGMSEWLPFLPEKSVRTLKKRLAAVHDHIASCRSRFGPRDPSDDDGQR